jgi:transcription elongation factor Elf1
VTHICHTATFTPGDTPARMLDDLACPCCGRQHVGDAHTRIADNKVRVYCDDCGAFATIVLSNEQTLALSSAFAK